MNDVALRQRASDAVEREIERLLEPGLRANAWRPDYAAFREHRLWDEHAHGRRVRMLGKLWRRVPPPVLDLGTGRGGLAVALQGAGFRVVPLDLRQSSCRITQLRGVRYGMRLPALRARAEQLPFDDETFGAVVCRDVLEHCEAPGLVLAEIWRVLRRGGSCFVTVINRWCWVDPHYHLFGLAFMPRPWAERYVRLRGRSKPPSADRQGIGELRYFAYGEFVRWAQACGFAVRDLGAETLARYRRAGAVAAARWVAARLLCRFSLQSNHFEFLLSKPHDGSSAEVR